MNKTSRLFALLDALRGHRRPVTAAHLAEQLAVSVRTIYRDMQDLVEMGAPVEGEAGMGYVLRAGFFLPPLMFAEDEIEALVLGARWVQKQGDEALAQAAAAALAKIATATPADLRDRMADAGLLIFSDSGGIETALATIRQSIRRECKLVLWYTDDMAHRPNASYGWPSWKTNACWQPGANCAAAFGISAPTASCRRRQTAHAIRVAGMSWSRPGGWNRKFLSTADMN